MIKPKKRRFYKIHWDGKDYQGNVNQISKESGNPIDRLWLAVTAPTSKRYGEAYGTQYPIFDIYKVKSGEYMGTGTVEDVAEKLKRSVSALNTKETYKKVFTGEYKIVKDDNMRVKRTHDKYAPILTEGKHEPVKKEEMIISRTVEPAEFKVGRYAQSLHDSYFAKWNLKEG